MTATISDEDVRNLLCSSFEGGSDYWACNLSYELEPELTIKEFRPGGKHYRNDWQYWYTIPFIDGCSVLVDEDNEDGTCTTHRVNRESIQKALDLMADPNVSPPFHLTNLLEDNTDAETGDVFLNLVCFGEIKYG